MPGDPKLNFLYPFRFISLTSHLLITTQLFEASNDLVRVTMSTTDGEHKFDSRTRTLNNFIVASLVLQCIDLLSLLLGTSLSFPKVTMANGVSHFFGFVFTFFVIVDGWNWISVLCIFWIFTAPPAILELLITFSGALWGLILLPRNAFLFLRKICSCFQRPHNATTRNVPNGGESSQLMRETGGLAGNDDDVEL